MSCNEFFKIVCATRTPPRPKRALRIGGLEGWRVDGLRIKMGIVGWKANGRQSWSNSAIPEGLTF